MYLTPPGTHCKLAQVTANYQTVNGTAAAPADYTAHPLTTLTFLPGETTKTVTVADAQAMEPDGGTINAVFSVKLSAPSGQRVTVQYATAGGTAAAGADYNAVTPTTLTFLPGQTTKLVPVQVRGDLVREANETFFLNLSGATNATIMDAQARGTILNDD